MHLHYYTYMINNPASYHPLATTSILRTLFTTFQNFYFRLRQPSSSYKRNVEFTLILTKVLKLYATCHTCVLSLLKRYHNNMRL